MSASDKYYDIAISFADTCMGLAREIDQALLKKGVAEENIFFYPRRTVEAGGKGKDFYKELFLEKSTVVIVVYSKEWGITPFCEKEKEGIYERLGKNTHDWLITIRAINRNEESPPEELRNQTYLDFAKVTIEEMANTSIARLRDCGVVSKQSGIGKSAQDAIERQESYRLLMEKGVGAAQNEYRTLENVLPNKIEELELQNIITYERLPYNELCIRTNKISAIFDLHLKTLSQVEFSTHDDRTSDMFTISHRKSEGGWCWNEDGTEKYLTTEKLAEFGIKKLLAENRKIPRP